ncbi:MAG: 50S ribosomal protein L25 [Nitrospinae bacterium]|nr:50S ribosomal protein L25 [Nitrospinota bacterium]
METIEIKVDKRAEAGKKSSSTLRRGGSIPVVIYGLGKSQKLSVNAYNFRKALSGPGGTNVILKLDLGDGKTLHNAMLKEIQYHPITEALIHADLLEIDMNKAIRVKLPLEFKGDPVGVKLKGGEMRVHMRRMDVECLPSAIPSAIVVDVSSLDLNKIWHVSDVAVPAGITKKDLATAAVVSCMTIKEIKEEVAAVAPVEGAEGAAPAEGAPAAGGKAPAGGGKAAAPAAGGKTAPTAGGKAPAGKAPAGKDAGKK